MGIDIETARFIMRGAKQYVSGNRILTVGRQNLQTGQQELKNLFDEFGIPTDRRPDFSWNHGANPYADPLFECLGASVIESIDVSNYEGAQLVHDLNLPIPNDWKRSYDLVCECGSLEHVFNFPIAVTNCLGMVKQGGRLLWVTPANNFFGHGFYQFSPELLYRVLSPENGFEVEEMIAVEYGPLRKWYRVIDPARKRDRVKLINKYPVQLIAIAKRISDVEPFSTIPQQSDYSAMWDKHSSAPAAAPSKKSRKRRIKDLLIETAPRLTRIMQSFQNSSWNMDFSFKNPSSFSSIDKHARSKRGN